MSENRDQKTTTDLVNMENELNRAFTYASARIYSAEYVASMGTIAQAIVEVRRQRHIEEGRGEMYQTRHNVSVPQTRSINRKG
ncbi:MAG: hypothetical protein EA357_08890 [Micavibrio sp.]|nr:MAG: hypothetical protein EA357_08890 [Micavibrio sp.]